jgi:bleomycin hydrolase
MQKFNISNEYNIDLWDEGVCDQMDNQRCWIYASLNPIRQQLSQKLKLKQQNFKLSTNYIFYYAMLYRCKEAIENIVLNKEIQTDEIISSKGQWCYFADICEKYGVVPLEMMPDTESTFNDSKLLNELNNLIIQSTFELKKAVDSDNIKSNILSKAKVILNNYLGAPPKKFNFTWIDKDNKKQEIKDISPVDFLEKHCNYKVSDYVMIINHPSKKYKFDCAYCEDMSSENPYLKMLNLDIQTIKKLVVEQLKDGEQVVIGSDVLQQSNQLLGILDTEFVCSSNNFTKEQRIENKLICARHIMSIDGVHIDDNEKPIRFKVQDSHGGKTGPNGHYTMSTNWFDEYVLNVVINKKHLSSKQKEILNKEAIFMPKGERF